MMSSYSCCVRQDRYNIIFIERPISAGILVKQLETTKLSKARDNPSIPPRTVLKTLLARPALPKTVKDLFNLPDAYTKGTDGAKFLATL